MQVISRQHSQGETDLVDLQMCKQVAEILMKHYEGHLWHVSVDSSPNNGTIDIKLAYPDKLGCLPKFGYKLHIHTCNEKKIIRAGGELLERFNIARSRATQYVALDVIKNGLDKSGAA